MVSLKKKKAPAEVKAPGVPRIKPISKVHGKLASEIMNTRDGELDNAVPGELAEFVSKSRRVASIVLDLVEK